MIKNLDQSPFLYGQRMVADLHMKPGDNAGTLNDYLAEQVDTEAFYEQEHDHATFGLGYLGDSDPPHEGGKAAALTLASVVGMFIVQRVKRFVDTHDAAPSAAVARISLEFE